MRAVKSLIVTWVASLCAVAGAAVKEVASDETVTDANLATYTGASGINIAQGATLTFSPTAAVTLTVPLSGGGTFCARDAGILKLKADNSAFTGSFAFTNTTVWISHPLALGNGCPVDFAGNKQDTGKLVYETSGVFSNPLTLGAFGTAGNEHYLDVNTGYCVTNTGLVTLKGYYRLRPYGYLAFGGGVTNTIGNDLVINNQFEAYGDLPISMNNRSFYNDSGHMYLGTTAITNASSVMVAKSTCTFMGENRLTKSQKLSTGIGYGAWFTLDLNGFDQQCGQWNLAPYASGNTYASNRRQVISSQSPATLSVYVGLSNAKTFEGFIDGAASLALDNASIALVINGGVTGYGPGVAGGTTTGQLVVRKGSLTIGENTSFPNLGGLVATNQGAITVRSLDINPEMTVTLADEGSLTLDDGLRLAVKAATVNGRPLATGRSYTKDSPEMEGLLKGEGTLYVSSAQRAVFTWVGGTDGDALASAANWKGGVAPQFDGSERLIFGEGTAMAVVAGTVKAFAIDIVTNAAFTLAAADAAAKIQLFGGGLTLSNTTENASAVVTHAISCPIELAEVPQTWTVATNTVFDNLAPLSGPASAGSLLLHSYGRTNFRADNSGLLTVLDVKNADTTAGQPYVYHEKGLGAPSRPTRFTFCHPRFIVPTGTWKTNAVPLWITRGNTGSCGWSGPRNQNNSTRVVQQGELRALGGNTLDFQLGIATEYRGGITTENNQSIILRLGGTDHWIYDKPVVLQGDLDFDYGMTMHLCTTGNVWRSIMLRKNGVSCGCDYALSTNGTVTFGSANTVYVSVSNSVLNLNGTHQQVTRLVRAWDPWNTTYATFPIMYARVKSAEPGVLTVKGETTEEDSIPLQFEGAAGFCYDKLGSFSFTNRLSTTTGLLEVKRGTVRFLAGAGWPATTNVVLSGGTLAVTQGTGATAFGAEQGRSEAEMVYTDGTLELATGEQATVKILGYPKANGQLGYYDPGVYGGSAAGLDARHTLPWITGAGTLRVLRTGSKRTLILFR